MTYNSFKLQKSYLFWIQKFNPFLQTQIAQFHDKHRVTKESGLAAMQPERRKGVLAAIGLAAFGITLVISVTTLVYVGAASFTIVLC